MQFLPERRPAIAAIAVRHTRLVADNDQYWMDPTLNDLERQPDPARYFRISRAAMIDLNAEILLKNGSGWRSAAAASATFLTRWRKSTSSASCRAALCRTD
jgi:hypothetical protein